MTRLTVSSRTYLWSAYAGELNDWVSGSFAAGGISSEQQQHPHIYLYVHHDTDINEVREFNAYFDVIHTRDAERLRTALIDWLYQGLTSLAHSDRIASERYPTRRLILLAWEAVNPKFYAMRVMYPLALLLAAARQGASAAV